MFERTALVPPNPTGVEAGTPAIAGTNLASTTPSTFTTDAAGLLRYTQTPIGGSTTTYGRGTATDHESGRVTDIIGWTRWAGGTTTYTAAGATLNDTTVAENGGLHRVWGTRATDLPTMGSASYDMIGSTAVTSSDGGAPGTVTSSSMRVAFGPVPKVGLEIGVSLAGQSWALSSTGGAAAPSIAVNTENMRFADSLSLAVNGAASSAASVDGFLAGTGASHAGLQFGFSTTPGRSPVRAEGVIAFAKRP